MKPLRTPSTNYSLKVIGSRHHGGHARWLYKTRLYIQENSKGGFKNLVAVSTMIFMPSWQQKGRISWICSSWTMLGAWSGYVDSWLFLLFFSSIYYPKLTCLFSGRLLSYWIILLRTKRRKSLFYQFLLDYSRERKLGILKNFLCCFKLLFHYDWPAVCREFPHCHVPYIKCTFS